MLQQLPESERGRNFCMRVAGGDVDRADRYYRDMPASEVWREYAHQLLYYRQVTKP